ncbi:hypothetical protein QVD17_31571 [Tagetes erecta]|uniref:Alanine aminotransferase n=1 Tax=Tagetes erecta TaxID=13708 RepID=A0AAD8K4S2_TARER|nr:hypothetical protein QVD17_31571 [Tagetes erecta]
MSRKALDYDQINENVKKAQYAVRGELYLRASELQKEGKKIIFTNVGNPHALGQKPLTFPRQVVALCQAPFLLDDPNVGLIFPADAIAKAKQYLSYTSGGLGASNDSRGLPGIRKEYVCVVILHQERTLLRSKTKHYFLWAVAHLVLNPGSANVTLPKVHSDSDRLALQGISDRIRCSCLSESDS